MKPNRSQQQALDSKVSTIISAGAGSGKTAVLTEKVYGLIEQGVIDINNLLVLTFTNPAAYSMKMKIIKKFKEVNSNFKDKVVSAHIQTYDSFSLDLVKKYSLELGLNPHINVVNEALMKSKVKDYINEVIDSKYISNIEDIRYFLNSLCFNGDDNLRTLIFDIYQKLESFTPSTREEFISNYNDIYLNKENLTNLFNKEIFHKSILPTINDIYKLLNDYSDLSVLSSLNEYISLIKVDETNYKLYQLNNEIDYLSFSTKIIEILKKYTKKVKVINEYSYKEKFIDDKTKISNNLKSYLVYFNVNEQVERLLKQKRIINLIFSVIKEVDIKIDNYKRLTSSYTFSDIAKYSLLLLKDERFKDIKEEIRNTYKFILVDEYQDTNDIQEEFINELVNNSDNKLFVVGDVKQSIYGFRNANPKLFIERRKKYLEEGETKAMVVDMNTNYRSIKKILDDINKYCESNMSLDHGNIEFNDNERLVYDEEVDLYKTNELEENKDGEYGISVISPLSLPYQEDKISIATPYIYVIAKDIITKINNKYQVIDKIEDNVIKYRDVKFSDFAILTRTGRTYKEFTYIFEKLNIPLNLVFDSAYRNEIIIEVIENIIRFTIDYLNNDETNYPHYFMSLARSYLYEYNDEKIFNILHVTNSFKGIDSFKRIENIKNNEIYLDIANFATNIISKDENISLIFNKLVSYFGIIKKLDRFGDIENNINIIEVFYSIIKSLDDASTSLEGLRLILDSLVANKIELKASKVVENNNAVTLETMHKSKGLEYKIVYIPFNDASFSEQTVKKPLVSKDYGLFIKNGYDFDIPLYNYFYKKEAESLKKEECDEFERIIYVALTRAKESLILVDNFKQNDKVCLYNEYYKAYKEQIAFNDDLFNICYLKEDLILKKIIPDYKIEVEIYNNLVLNNESYLEDKLNTFSDVNLLDNLRSLAIDELNAKKVFISQSKDSPIDKLTYKEIKASQEIRGSVLTYLRKNIYNGASYLLSYALKRLNSLTGCINFKELDNKYKNKLFLRNYLNYYNEISKDSSKQISFKISDPTSYYVLENIILPRLNVSLDIYPILSSYPNESKYRFISLKEEINPLSIKDNVKELKVEEVYDKLSVNDNIYSFKEKINKRASHKKEQVNLSLDKDIKEDIDQDKLSRGILYHKILELLDFKKKDYSFIKDNNIRKLIENIMNLDILKDVNEAKIYKEYQYLIDGQEGIIDLLLVYNDKIKIIDYKTKNIDDEAYNHQLNVYRSNIEKLFNITNIKMYLLSIVDCTFKEVNKEDIK